MKRDRAPARLSRDSVAHLAMPMAIVVAGAIAYAMIVCSLDLARSRGPCGRMLQRGLAYMRAGLARS